MNTQPTKRICHLIRMQLHERKGSIYLFPLLFSPIMIAISWLIYNSNPQQVITTSADSLLTIIIPLYIYSFFVSFTQNRQKMLLPASPLEKYISIFTSATLTIIATLLLTTVLTCLLLLPIANFAFSISVPKIFSIFFSAFNIISPLIGIVVSISLLLFIFASKSPSNSRYAVLATLTVILTSWISSIIYLSHIAPTTKHFAFYLSTSIMIVGGIIWSYFLFKKIQIKKS